MGNDITVLLANLQEEIAWKSSRWWKVNDEKILGVMEY
jgi:hypothetical protein